MAQSYPSVEHIVVDGGSADGTHEILKRYEDRYNLRWTSGPDTGMYQAINRGFKASRGELLAYLNSDDLYLPWTVEAVVRRIEDDPDVDVVFGDAVLLDEASGRARIAFYAPFTRAFALRSGSLIQPTVFWRRSAYEAVSGFDEQLRFVGDLDFWIRLGERCRFAKINEILAVERQHAAAKTFAASEALLAEARAVRNRHDARTLGRGTLGTAERVRSWLWRRVYWVKFLLASRGVLVSEHQWTKFLSAARPRISLVRVVLVQLPFLGWRYAYDAVMPSRAWINRLVGTSEGDIE
jgi:glycosyltransferase involved in cell wall biosynthesis